MGHTLVNSLPVLVSVLQDVTEVLAFVADFGVRSPPAFSFEGAFGPEAIFFFTAVIATESVQEVV